MKKVVRYVDEDTLEIMEKVVDDGIPENEVDQVVDLFERALGCEPEEFSEKYRKFKEAEREFKEIYEPFKDNLIKLHENHPEVPKSVVIGNTKLTYVSPSTRATIDNKKLKEEEPEIAKKYMKMTNVKASVRLEETI